MIQDLKNFAFAVTDEEKRKLAMEIVEEFEKTVKPVEDQLEKAIIHGRA